MDQYKPILINSLIEELKLKSSTDLIVQLNKLDVKTLKLIIRQVQSFSMEKLPLGGRPE